jgi:hypothetical protein
MKPDIRITKKLIANRDYGGKNYNVLPVYDDGTQCLSCWKLSLKERSSVLLKGRIWLCVQGRQVPVWLEAIEKNVVN